MSAFFGGKGGVGELIVRGGGLGRPDGKYLQILDLQRLASLRFDRLDILQIGITVN